MSYNGNENAIDHSFSEEDFLKSAKSHIHGFIEVLIGLAIGLAVLGLLLSTLIGTISCIGGCFGCEACIETAGCADEMLDECFDGCIECDYQELTEENVANANDCVSCDGIDCFGREGCFACDGCGDCDDCAGTKYYNITVEVRGETHELRVEESDLYIPLSISGSTIYYEYQGLFDQTTGGTCYVDTEGYIVKPLQDNLKLYARYNEYNAGETYYFELSLAEFGMADTTIQLTVGGALVGLPVAPEKEGYEFVGWYLNDVCVQSGNVGAGATFHLYNFEIDPSNTNRTFTLRPVFEEKEYTITLVAYGYSYQIKAAYNSTFGEVFNYYYNWYNNLSYDDSFFGWGLAEDTEPEEKVDSSTLITGDTTVYAIFRQPVHAQFYYNSENKYYEYIDVKFREGQKNVVFDELEELEPIAVSEDANPGYKFAGWYKDRSPSNYETPKEGIDNVERYETYQYYAKWVQTDYKITYKVTNYVTGETSDVLGGSYYMSNEAHELFTAEDVLYNVGYDFMGWRQSESDESYYTALPAGTYGTQVLYAYYKPDTYTVGLKARGGSFIENGRNALNVDRTYGSEYTLPVPIREGYEFIGFYYDDGDGNNDNDVQCTDGLGVGLKKFTLDTFGLELNKTEETKLSGNIELYAKWKIQVLEVTFMVENEVYARIEVDYGNTISNEQKPKDPVITGYDFKGWAYEDGTTFSFITPIKADQVLVAKLQKQRYDIKFIYNGTEYIAYQVEYQESFTKAVAYASVPANGERYKLLGWYKDESKTKPVPDNAKIEGAATYYADVQEATKFIFHKATVTNGEKYYFVGDTYTFPEATKEGYKFVGWCSDESLLTAPILGDKKIQSNMPTEYWPKFEAIPYTITYKYIPSGSTEYIEYKKDTYTIAETKYLISTSEMAERTGYTFVGWTESDSDSGSYITQLIGQIHDRTYYAQYTANEYTVTLYDHQGNPTGTKTVTYDQGFDFDVPSEKDGYDFYGWSYTQNGTVDTVITDVTGKSLMGVVYNQYASDKNVYPIYTKKKYDIHWYNTIENEVITTTQAEHFDYIHQITDPKQDGYTFGGWYADGELTQPYDFNVRVTSGATIYAKFNINTYKVTFMVGGQEKHVENGLEYKSSLADALETAQDDAENYAEANKGLFSHWEATDGTLYTSSSTVPAGDLTLKAIYKLPTYMQFMTEEGKVEQGPYYVGQSVTEYNYTKPGYKRLGWYTDGYHTTQQIFPYVLEGSNTEMYGAIITKREKPFYAKFEAKAVTIYYYENYEGSTSRKDTRYSNTAEIEEGVEAYVPDATDRKGYVFKGWYVGGTRDESMQMSGTPTNTITREHIISGSSFDSEIYCYGVWEKATYTITFKIGATTWQTKTYTYGDYIGRLDIPTATDLPDGRVFEGWRIIGPPVTDDIGKMVTYDDGDWMTGYDGYYRWEGDLVLQAATYY